MYVQETKPCRLLSSAASQTFGTFGCVFGKSKPYLRTFGMRTNISVTGIHTSDLITCNSISSVEGQA
jgi:hypothetical protein